MAKQAHKNLYRLFKSSLEELSLKLPKHVYAEEKKEGIRVAAKQLMGFKVQGKSWKGILAFSSHLTHSFILTFGHLAKKKIELSKQEVSLYFSGKAFSLKKERAESLSRDSSSFKFVVTYKGFPLGLAELKGNTLFPLLPASYKRSSILFKS